MTPRPYPRAVDRIPYSAMLETHGLEEIAEPPVRPIRFPIRTRWLILQFKTRSCWRDWWRDLIFLVQGQGRRTTSERRDRGEGRELER